MHTRTASFVVAGLALAGWLGCNTPPEIPDTFGVEATSAEETTPLGGEALDLRKREMSRAHRDMKHFQVTLRSLDEHSDRNGKILFGQFLDAFIGLHLDPMLRSDWQSNHPELMALDAGLRLAKADVLIQMRQQRRAQKVLDELMLRFQGRENMLVDYPVGGQTTLGQALEMLRQRKWRG